MAVFHQMGHQSHNLLSCEHLTKFRGAILSPVNYDKAGIARIIDTYRSDENFETIFDPQLYYPRTERGQLASWYYFPDDVMTADLSSHDWWKDLVSRLTTTLTEITPNSVCSPIIVPRDFQNDYYLTMNHITQDLCEAVAPHGIDVLQTVMVSAATLASFRRVHEIASIVTQTPVSRVYLIIFADIEPRREFTDPEEIKGIMLFIRLLEDAGLAVTVGYCSSDIVLWKQAGASNCASGKFFNLRRFTPSRWDENEEGGRGQLPWWFEESLLAYIRDSDLIRLQRKNLLSDVSYSNPYLAEILECVNTGQPWLGLAWRQYLYWFAEFESRITNGTTGVSKLLREVDNNWLNLDNKGVILEDRRNNGAWIRQWLRALTEYQEPW